MWRPRRWRRGEPGDDGMVTAFVIMFSVALLFVTALALDGGRILTAKREARNVAQSAARAGAQVLDEEAVRANADEILDEGGAQDAACVFLDRAEHPCGSESSVSFDVNEVVVTVNQSVDMAMLPGVPAQSFTVEGRACVARGITDAPPC
ncbi:MAG: Tad domain-containing protein [Acidimicrobiales bacterium]